MSSHVIYDVIVVGGGPVGLATAYEVAKSGGKVVVLEKNNFFNQAGSSNDMARMYRTMYTEDFMADLAHQSLAVWDELESDAGVSLRSMSGLLNFGDPTVGKETPEGGLLDPIENLERLHMPYKKLKPKDIEAKWPFKNLPDDYVGIFAPDNGVINVQALLRTLHRLAKDYGSEARQHVNVKGMTPAQTEDGQQTWKLDTEHPQHGSVVFEGRKIVITSGAYTNHILKPSFDFELDLHIWEMVASYFNVNAGPRGTVFPSMWFQFAKDKVGIEGVQRSQLFYGFPAVEWGPPNVARIAVDAASRVISDPNDRLTNVINPADILDTQEYIEKHIVGVDATVPAFSLSCLQTNVYDNMFVLDFVPEEYLKGGAKDSVVVFTAGWAMKFVPLLGRALKELALDGRTTYRIDKFSMTREGKEPGQYIIKPKDPQMSMAHNFSKMSQAGKMQASGSSVHIPKVLV